MHRRTNLGLAAGARAALAGCTAIALPGPAATDETTPPDGDRFAGDCPDLVDDGRATCTADDAGPLAVERSPRRAVGDDWSVRVTVINRADEPYGTNPYAWSVSRWAGGGWAPVAPDARVEPWLALAPGASYTGQLSTAATTATTAPADDAADQRVYLDLRPGTYAFVVPFDGPERVVAVAVFDREA